MTEQTNALEGIVVRRARAEDVDRILDLLTEYELPRSYFEPFFLGDSTYRPEQSWLVEQDGRLAAHLRLFDRWIRMYQTAVHIAGVGSVITARAFRGQGHAGRLLRAMAAGATTERFAYSVLWTHAPTLYERHGWVTIEQQTVRATLSELPPDSITIDSFGPEDLAEVTRLYETSNEHRTGPAIRTPEYWQSQFGWLSDNPADFLIARRRDGSLAGYVRGSSTPSEVRLLELGARTEDIVVGRCLVARIAQGRGGRMQARLPGSLFGVLPDSERDVEDDSTFMGRVLSLEALVRTLEPTLLRRLEDAGLRTAVCWLPAGAGSAELRLADGHATLDHQRSPVDPHTSLTQGQFAHLLFHGFDPLAEKLLEGRPDSDLLKILFPAQDFIIWPADAF